MPAAAPQRRRAAFPRSDRPTKPSCGRAHPNSLRVHRPGERYRSPRAPIAPSMASAFHLPLSFSIEQAAERKPCPVISSSAKPSRRKAALTVFSLMQRAVERTDGKRNLPAPVMAWSSRRMATACGASGTRRGRLIFIFSLGWTKTGVQIDSALRPREARRVGRRSGRAIRAPRAFPARRHSP